jgi:hypothetical protein
VVVVVHIMVVALLGLAELVAVVMQLELVGRLGQLILAAAEEDVMMLQLLAAQAAAVLSLSNT